MFILFNGKVGARQHRILVVIVDGELHMFRPYVGWYYSWPKEWDVWGQELMEVF